MVYWTEAVMLARMLLEQPTSMVSRVSSRMNRKNGDKSPDECAIKVLLIDEVI